VECVDDVFSDVLVLQHNHDERSQYEAAVRRRRLERQHLVSVQAARQVHFTSFQVFSFPARGTRDMRPRAIRRRHPLVAAGDIVRVSLGGDQHGFPAVDYVATALAVTLVATG
jgi:hypothetical protein